VRFKAALAGSALTLVILVGLGPVAPRTAAAPALPAFPGAEGFGAGATGGRSGQVYIVTTLEPFGPGSLGDALAPPAESCTPRIIVFDVSGVIEVPGKHDLELTCGNVTIAGQTAPGAGITIAGRLIGAYADDLVDGDYPLRNIIIRHLRVRPTPLTAADTEETRRQNDALNLSRASLIVLDHVTTSWASDETIDLYEAVDVTVQWSTVEESNPLPLAEGDPHNYGLIVGEDIRFGQRVSIHHVLFAHHQSRTPAVAHGPAEIVNNVSYDVRAGFVHDNAASGEFHIVGNTYKQGPGDDDLVPFFFNDEDHGVSDDVRPTYFLEQNRIVDLDPPFDAIIDGVLGTPYEEDAFAQYPELRSAMVDTRSDFSAVSPNHLPITEQATDAAFESVLVGAGAFPRDGTTRRIVEEVRTGGGGWAPNPPADLLEGLTPGTAPTDADRDGMADDWESANGLNPGDPSDHASVMASGYTAIEVYVNGLSDTLVGAPAPGPGQPGGSVVGDGVPAPTQAGPVATPRPAASGTSPGGPGSTGLLAAVAAVLSAVAAALSATSLYIVRARQRDGPPPGT
jgi:pectate lyase